MNDHGKPVIWTESLDKNEQLLEVDESISYRTVNEQIKPSLYVKFPYIISYHKINFTWENPALNLVIHFNLP